MELFTGTLNRKKKLWQLLLCFFYILLIINFQFTLYNRDNMLISSKGHVKLTDFGLSKVDYEGDLEMSDLITSTSPNFLNARTPGQLLSLTSHLSFGSADRKNSQLCGSDIIKMRFNSKSDSSDANDSKISGVSPFFSAEDVNFSPVNNHRFSSSESSYVTAESSVSNTEYDKENSRNVNFLTEKVAFKLHEDSGISSRKGDASGDLPNELSLDANISSISSSEHGKNNFHENSKLDLKSPLCSNYFKRPVSRKRSLASRVDFSLEEDGCNHTGLTQEIEIMLDMGSSTPKKHKSKDSFSGLQMLKLKSPEDRSIRSLNSNLMVSTPVSSQKVTRNKKKNNILRFVVPNLSIIQQKQIDQIGKTQICDESAMSPIQNSSQKFNEYTPKLRKTPFRTPKSVCRRSITSDERILGTPDYLAPEILMR